MNGPCTMPALVVWILFLMTVGILQGATEVSGLLPFGPAQGDSYLQDDGTSVAGLKDVASPTFVPPYRFPACGSLQQSIYFTDNGLIVMYNGKKEKYAYPRPTDGNSFGASLRDRVFIAPFFSDVDETAFSSESNIYYQVYERSGADSLQLDVLNTTDETINGLQNSTFSVEWMLVITWDRVLSNSPSELSNTFQAVVATDGRKGYTIFHYQVGHMSWDFDVLPFPDVVIGYKCPDGDSMYIQDPDPSDSIDIHKRPDKYLGNTNLTGVWVYRLDSNLDTYVNPEQECDQWQSTQPDPTSWYIDGDCPCSGFQAMSDSRYELLNLTDLGIDEVEAFNWPSPTDCFYRTFKRNGLPGVLCCYNNLNALRQFPNDVFYGAVFERFSFNPFYPTHNVSEDYNTWIEKEVFPRYYCCVASCNPIFCGKYESKRPVKTCSSYIEPTLAWCLGDPHFTTLDKTQYTFNGRGEFFLLFILSDILNLQARTVFDNSVVANPNAIATHFTYFAVKHHQITESIGFEVDAAGTGFIVRSELTSIATEEQLTQGMFQGSCLIKKKDSRHIVFSCEDGMAFTFGIEHGVGDLLVSLPHIYKNRIYGGLLGNWDDDPINDIREGLLSTDLIPATGPNGMFSTSDLLTFGRSWKTGGGQLFFYEIPSTYGTHSKQIVPSFLADMQGATDPVQLNAIKTICQNEDICIYDILATNNTALGLATKQQNNDNLLRQENLNNFPPLITVDVTSIEVYVGSVFTLQLLAEDRNHDNVTFSLLSLVPNASITSGGLFTWSPSSLDKVNLTFVADDGVLQSSVTPIVKLCNCLSETQCNYNQSQQDSKVFIDKFVIASCDCPTGMSGATCEEDFNPCIVEPCFPGVDCIDQPANGLTNDGFTCQDNVSPTVICPASTEVLHQTNEGIIDWSPMPSAVDAVDGDIASNISCVNGDGSPVMSGDTFNVGSTNVTCTAIDSSGNAGSCHFNITVIDNVSPTVICPASTKVLHQTNEGIIDWSPMPSAVDAVDGDIACSNISCVNGDGSPLMSGDTFNVGSTIVTCTAMDSSGNAGFCHFNITVNDNVGPLVTCPKSVVYTDAEPQINYTVPSAFDAVDGNITSTNISCVNGDSSPVKSGDTFNVGSTIVTCTAMDSSGNSGSCHFNITVNVTRKFIVTIKVTKINGNTTDYTSQYEDLQSQESVNLLYVFITVMNKVLSSNSASTEGLVRISVTKIRRGSVIVTMLVEYYTGSTVTGSIIQRVLEKDINDDNLLTDGNENIVVQRRSLIVDTNSTVDECPILYCFNGGTCNRQGIFPNIIHSCSCPAEYTGEYCDVKVTGGGGGGVGLSTGVNIAIVIVASVSGFVIVLIILMLCMCLLMRYRFEKELAVKRQCSFAPKNGKNKDFELDTLAHRAAFPPYLQQKYRARSSKEQARRMTGNGIHVPWYGKGTLAGWL